MTVTPPPSPTAPQAPIRQGGSSSRRSSYTSPTVPVVASFTTNITSGTAPLGVAFTDTSTGTPTVWTWNATNVTGDNIPYTFSTVQNPTEPFGIGNYSIVLTASKATGSDTSDPMWINVTNPCMGTIGDIVWNDLNHDGIQDAGEPGLSGITVELVDPDSRTVLQSMPTDLNGMYQFDTLCTGTYEVRVNSTTLPSDFVPTVSLVGSPATDSDGSPETVILPTDASSNLTIDFGYYEQIIGITIEKLTNGEDADIPPGPSVPFGSPVLWTYVVTNTGNAALSSVTVTDDHGIVVTCPKIVLQPGESMTCTASGTAVAGQYMNVGTATGTPPVGSTVSASDPSHYFGVIFPSIQIEKRVNGGDADTPTGPLVTVGDPIVWTYMVTNTGDITLSSVTVTDDRGVTVTCPKTVLAPGEAMTCTASGTAVAGQYANIGTATGTPPYGPTVTDSDPSHYFGILPVLSVEVLTNGQEADTPPGPSITVGDSVSWTYQVTNTGTVVLNTVAVTDSNGVAVTCPVTTLAPGESMTCTASGTAVAGQYANIGTATGTPPVGTPVTASDPSHYFGVVSPAIMIEKLTNGLDADTLPGPSVLVGSTVLWTYVVTNTGDVGLNNVAVTDDQGVTVTCPKTVLEPGESMTCTASDTAVAGQYANIGTATGTPPVGPPVSATDPSHYLGGS